MRALDGAAADVERRSQPAIDVEVGGADCRADDVDDGVDGAYFVEVNLLNRHGVDSRFRLRRGVEMRAMPRLFTESESGADWMIPRIVESDRWG